MNNEDSNNDPKEKLKATTEINTPFNENEGIKQALDSLQEDEKKKALEEFQKIVLRFQKKEERKPKIYSGKDFEVRSRAGSFLRCHRSESGTLYIVDKRGAWRKATPELISILSEELSELAEKVLPHDNFGQK